MIAMIGAFLGLRLALLTLMLASLLGALVGLIYVVATRKDSSTYELPFGSFLGLAALIVGLFGQVIVVWYSHLGA
jgi:leader peptidase (prepilin peptidase)/N-methyltransferase